MTIYDQPTEPLPIVRLRSSGQAIDYQKLKQLSDRSRIRMFLLYRLALKGLVPSAMRP